MKMMKQNKKKLEATPNCTFLVLCQHSVLRTLGNPCGRPQWLTAFCQAEANSADNLGCLTPLHKE